MAYIRTADSTYPLSERDIREAFPNTSFADPFVPPDGYAWVFPSPRPAHNAISQFVREIAPAQTNGQWYEQYEVVELEPEAVEANLANARAVRWEQIKQTRDAKTQNGGYLAATKWFHSDTFSRTQQLGLVMMGPSIPEGLQWKTMDGSFVAMTPTLASQVFAAAAAQDAALFAHAEALKAQVDAAADPNAVDISAGWPATFPG